MITLQKITRSSGLWLAIGAILLFLSSLQPSISLAAWVAPVFLLRFARSQRPRTGLLRLALVMSVTLSIKWAITFAPATMLGICGAIAALITLLGYAIDRTLSPRLTGVTSTLVFPLSMTILDWISSHIAGFLSSTLLPSLVGVGATWNPVFYTQAANLPLIQVVSLTGPWGLTFLITWFAPIVNALWENDFNMRRVRASLIGFAALLIAALAFGNARLAFHSDTPPTVAVAGIVAQEDLFNTITDMNPQELMPGTAATRETARRRFEPIVEDLFVRSQQEAAQGAKIIVWGEADAPVLEEDIPDVLARAANVAAGEHVYLQIGLVIFRDSEHYPFMENRAILFDPTGAQVWDYHKAYPTPGENTMVVAGPPIVPTVDTPYGRLATVLCYDNDFPELVRQAGQAGVDILFVPSKDWDSVKIQHAEMAKFRAIENGLSIVRPALSGLSSTIDPFGRITAQVNSFTTPDPTLRAQVSTGGTPTLYSHLGDGFAYLCLLALVFIIFLAFPGRRATDVPLPQMDAPAARAVHEQ